MNVFSPMECCQQTGEAVNLGCKLSACSMTEDTSCCNRTNPCGETYEPDSLDRSEDSPFCVNAEPVEGFWISEEPEAECSCVESLMSSDLFGHTLETHIVQQNPYLSEDSVALPVNVQCALQLVKSNTFSGLQAKSFREGKSLIDDESFFLSSSASILTDDFARIPEPIQAHLRYHRRKRLEWRLHSDYKTQDTSNSWTVYDDLLEELEQSIDASGGQRPPSVLYDQSLSYNALSYEHSKRMNSAIEKYLNQRFLTFQEGHPGDLNYQCLPSSLNKTFVEIATMTDQEEKEEEDSAKHKIAHCLPLCRCMPRR